MISSMEFIETARKVLGTELNDEQAKCVTADSTSPLLIVAGPGSGKTTVMVLRALRHLLVDGISPERIVITTFTKKAAQEIRTRWLDWGLPLVDAVRQLPEMQAPEAQQWLARLDLNRCITGTLDSICEELLGEYRPAGTVTPVLIEGYPANQMLLRSGLQEQYYANLDALNAYLAGYSFNRQQPRILADVIDGARPIMDRFIHDRVDIAAYRTSGPHAAAKEVMALAHDRYCAALAERSQMDFALLEREFLTRMNQGLLDEAIGGWQALLVDEYQDTNPLQESIYFDIVRRSRAALSVVGDDDQSLYRFRGATVELFTQFVQRLQMETGLQARTEYLMMNYRSTKEIVEFFSRFIGVDPGFAGARIQPPKPKIQADRKPSGIPVMGMFREDAQVLARDLSDFLHQVFRRGGVSRVLDDGSTLELSGADPGGDFGDAVLLSHTVREFGSSFGGAPPPERLPSMLRRELAALGVSVFNPRGQALRDQPNVRILLGLLLECLDRSSAVEPDGRITPLTKGLTNAVRSTLREWRQAAADFMQRNPAPGGLTGFVDAWSVQKSQTKEPWPEEWPVLELCFKLMSWIGEFRDDPEHQVWLEAISRAVAQSRLFSPYSGTILNSPKHKDLSRGSVIRDILRPIADGLVDVDEEIMPSVPRDRFALMTIHQAKGLEFPLTVVDISSNFKSNHRMTASQRFPASPSTVATLEDDLAPYTAVGADRIARSALDRTFDDLVRLYYVAYSRPQTALLLVGHEKTIAGGRTVKHVASGWRRNETWAWHDGANTTIANKLPLVLI